MPLGFKGYQKGHTGHRKHYTAKVECVCVVCGTKSVRRPCEVSRFCSHRCYSNSRIGIRPRGVTKPCARCGTMMTDSVTQIGKYCSKKCCDDDKRTDTATRFWPRVQKADGCWPWIANIGSDGYGKFWLNGRTTHAHRVAYELTFGKIPHDDPRLVCHRCDNPPCCNPEHLFLGTHQENMDDMDAKGRRVPRERLRVTKSCVICGTPFSHIPSRAAKTSACSQKCALALAWRRRRQQ